MLQREQIKKIFKRKSNATIHIHTRLMYEFIWWHFLKPPTLLCNNSLICTATGHRKPKGVNWSYFLVLICLLFCSAPSLWCHSAMTSRSLTRGSMSTLLKRRRGPWSRGNTDPTPRQDPELHGVHRHLVDSPQCAPFPDAKSALWESWQLLQEMGSRPLSWNSGIFVGSTGAQDPPSLEHLCDTPLEWSGLRRSVFRPLKEGVDD